jgi:branched-chain amino acid aminotransferase
MAFPGTGKIWMNGSLVDWADAKIHVASHVVHYGSAVFEGARCYSSPKGSACFRLEAHLRRLCGSAKIYRMNYPLGAEALQTAVLETIRANNFSACYIRPIIYRGYNSLGVNPLTCPVEAAIILWEWGTYLGAGALEGGVDVCVSSWSRLAPNTFPAFAKCSANYASAQLMKMEAVADGYVESLSLDIGGYLSEASAANVFLVRDGVLYTPPLASSILPGITRDSVMTMAGTLGYAVREEFLPREMIYVADEAFIAGTAPEITPIRSVDKITIGNGGRGPVTAALQSMFFGIINGEVPDSHGWLTYVYPDSPGARESARSAAVRV